MDWMAGTSFPDVFPLMPCTASDVWSCTCRSTTAVAELDDRREEERRHRSVAQLLEPRQREVGPGARRAAALREPNLGRTRPTVVVCGRGHEGMSVYTYVCAGRRSRPVACAAPSLVAAQPACCPCCLYIHCCCCLYIHCPTCPLLLLLPHTRIAINMPTAAHSLCSLDSSPLLAAATTCG